MSSTVDHGRRAIRCDQILATVRDANAGPSYSVSALATALAAQGCDTAILSLADWRAGGELPSMPGVAVHEFSRRTMPLLGSIAASPALRGAIEARRETSDIFHTHGLWLMPNVYPAAAARRAGARAKVVHSPRGMLGADALRYSPWKKRLFWWAKQHAALRAADCIHATAESEYREIRAAGLTNPVAIIPNGIALPSAAATPAPDSRTVLSLGRLHPKKGLDRLIAAWATLEADHPGWRLRIVGHDEDGYADRLRALCSESGVQHVTIEPPLHAAAKSRAYHDAALFVLPSLNENFAMTVAEALAHGIPAISSKGAPWAGLVDNGCGWWIDHDIAALAATLSAAMALPADTRRAMGASGREWMARAYSWEHVGAEMTEVYRWLGGQAPPPATVRFD